MEEHHKNPVKVPRRVPVLCKALQFPTTHYGELDIYALLLQMLPGGTKEIEMLYLEEGMNMVKGKVNIMY